MKEEFEKKVLLDNLSFIMHEKDIKVGTLESQIGVSPGYISRISKEGGTKPGIDFILSAASALGVSVDTLLRIPLADLTSTERYLLSFYEKLKNDTVAGKLDWARETAAYLNQLEPDINSYVHHPLMQYLTFMEEGPDFPEEVSRTVFVSDSFDVHTSINDDCFVQKLKNRNYLYLMNISKSVHYVKDKDIFAIEAWIWSDDNGTEFLGSDRKGNALSSAIKELYTAVKEYYRHPRVNANLKYVIDSFMKDDMSDDL